MNALIPWVFASQDLLLYHRLTGRAIPAPVEKEMISSLDGDITEILFDLTANNTVEYGTVEPWHEAYTTEFRRCLEYNEWYAEIRAYDWAAIQHQLAEAAV